MKDRKAAAAMAAVATENGNGGMEEEMDDVEKEIIQGRSGGVKGIIFPPPDIRAVVDKTAQWYVRFRFQRGGARSTDVPHVGSLFACLVWSALIAHTPLQRHSALSIAGWPATGRASRRAS